MTLQEWLDIGDNATLFREWRELPLTRTIIDLLRDECVPRKIPLHMLAANGSLIAAEENGRHLGMNHIVDLLRHADNPDRMKTQTTLQADYSLDEYLREEGWPEDEITKMMQHANREGTDHGG